jgi:hypothetical protein
MLLKIKVVKRWERWVPGVRRLREVETLCLDASEFQRIMRLPNATMEDTDKLQ